MNESRSRLRPTRKLLFGAVAAVLALGAGATSLWASGGPRYTDWSAPVNLGPTLNTTFLDTSPALSEDGVSLYFNSMRPGGFGGNDIWVSQRDSVDDEWGAPVNLGPTINTASNEAVPAFSRDGHWMFFASFGAGGFGGEDIWASWRPHTHDDFGWQAPINLGPNINTASGEGSPGYFENDDAGAPQLFFASLRPGGLGSADVWMSELQADGTWGPATPITELNSSASDTRTSISPDGLQIYLQSARAGGLGGDDLWVATRDTVDAPWSTPVNVGAPVNTSANDVRPYLSADGRRLFFGSDRPGGFGGTDLWMTTRDAKLTATADDQTRLFGQANPPLTYAITGFVGGETAAVMSGSAACSTTATPSSPAGHYPITCTVGSLTAPGYVFDSFVEGTLTVSYSRPCLTGPSAGPLHVAAGEAVCVGAGSVHTGPVTVAPGGSLDVEGGRIIGPVVTNGATAIRICGATITGPLTVSGNTGPVLVGGGGCAANTIVGPVRVTENSGGVGVDGNTVVGPLRVIGNSAPAHAVGNTVTGPVVLQP